MPNTVLIGLNIGWISADMQADSRELLLQKLLEILRTIAIRGHQEVNDPERPVFLLFGPQAGSFTSRVPLLR